MTISTILLYTGAGEFLADTFRSLSLQSRPCGQILAVDASPAQDLQPALNTVKDALPPGLEVFTADISKEPSHCQLLNLSAEKCRGDYLMFLPAHQLLAPRYFEACSQSLDADQGLGAVCTSIRLTGKEDAVVEISVPELLAFPQRDCFPLIRAEKFKKIGGFAEQNNHIVYADLLLRMVEADIAVKFLTACLVTARYEEQLHKPSLHKLDQSFERPLFLKNHALSVSRHAEAMVLCLEKEHARQQERFDRLVDHAHQNLLFVSNKQKAQEQFHKEQLSSISVTGRHLLSAVKRRLLLSRQ